MKTILYKLYYFFNLRSFVSYEQWGKIIRNSKDFKEARFLVNAFIGSHYKSNEFERYLFDAILTEEVKKNGVEWYMKLTDKKRRLLIK